MGFEAVSFDAALTLLHPAVPIADTYLRIARAHGHALAGVEPAVVGKRMRGAMREHAALRREDPSWRAYWREVVGVALGVADEHVLEDLYAHFAEPTAWRVAAGARECLVALRGHGLRIGLVSNWDARLRGVLEGLDLVACFDAILISAEVGLEKPDPAMFLRAAARLGVEPDRLLHVGDDATDDVAAARAAGCSALQMGHDVLDFAELSSRLVDGERER